MFFVMSWLHSAVRLREKHFIRIIYYYYINCF